MIFYNNFTAPSFIKGLVNPTLIRRKPKTASPKNGLAVFLRLKIIHLFKRKKNLRHYFFPFNALRILGMWFFKSLSISSSSPKTSFA